MWKVTLKKILGIVILLVVCVSCYKEEKAIARYKVKEKVISAHFDFRREQIIMVTKRSIYIVPVANTKIKIKRIEVPYSVLPPNMHLYGINCIDNKCWIGGGQMHKDGFLLRLNLDKMDIEGKYYDTMSEIYGIAINDNNIATCHGTGEVIIWNMDTGEKVKTFGHHKTEIFAVAFSADGKKIYTGDYDGLTLWDISTGKRIKYVSYSDNSTILTIIVDKDTNRVITSSAGTLYVHEEDSLSVVDKFALSEKRVILSCDLRDSDKKIICGMTGGYIGVINLDGTDRKVLRIHKDDVIYVKFIRDGEDVISVVKTERR